MKPDLQRTIVIESLELAFFNLDKMRISGALSTPTAQIEIERILGQVHAHILTANLASFTVDVRRLNFLSSSALRVFINWTSRAERARYKLVFITDPAVTWHRLNFSVLKSLAPQSVEIEARQGDGW